ncbi:MAG: hypothetical protein JXL85_09985 [Bacilli bacterium]|nr:hypothetical protein [Bacilli bacterium]
MKKIVIVMFLFLLSIGLVSCVDRENNIEYFGVATYYDGEDGNPLGLFVNIPSVGLMMIPVIDNTFSYIDNTHTDNYEIQNGDLMRIYFKDVTDVGILESYPGRFDKDPYSISIQRQNISMESTCLDSYYISFPIEYLGYLVQYGIDDLSVNVELTILIQYIVDKQPVMDHFTDTVIYELNEETIGIIVQSDAIDTFLEGMYWGELTFEIIP